MNTQLSRLDRLSLVGEKYTFTENGKLCVGTVVSSELSKHFNSTYFVMRREDGSKTTVLVPGQDNTPFGT